MTTSCEGKYSIFWPLQAMVHPTGSWVSMPAGISRTLYHHLYGLRNEKKSCIFNGFGQATWKTSDEVAKDVDTLEDLDLHGSKPPSPLQQPGGPEGPADI